MRQIQSYGTNTLSYCSRNPIMLSLWFLFAANSGVAFIKLVLNPHSDLRYSTDNFFSGGHDSDIFGLAAPYTWEVYTLQDFVQMVGFMQGLDDGRVVVGVEL
jgi:hypothetical protein